ncbi:hypothetical protein PMAYCL1PPCAC_20355, partial [Pristionchus mayeri]
LRVVVQEIRRPTLLSSSYEVPFPTKSPFPSPSVSHSSPADLKAALTSVLSDKVTIEDKSTRAVLVNVDEVVCTDMDQMVESLSVGGGSINKKREELVS